MKVYLNPVAGQDATAWAAELAERLVDEVSRADQDWFAIYQCSRELTELATRVIVRFTGPKGLPPG
jgi:hypothetical protein